MINNTNLITLKEKELYLQDMIDVYEGRKNIEKVEDPHTAIFMRTIMEEKEIIKETNKYIDPTSNLIDYNTVITEFYNYIESK